MSSIVAIVLEALKSNDSIISAESQMMTELSQLVCAGVAQACEQLDDDLRETCVLTGSDNGSGYSPKAFKELVPGAARWAHVLDGYHLNRKLKERFSMMPRDLQDLLRKSVWTGNKARTEMVLDTAESMVQDTDSGDSMRSEWLDNLTKLRRYLDRNWPYIEALSNRQLDRRGLGSCESNHRLCASCTKKIQCVYQVFSYRRY